MINFIRILLIIVSQLSFVFSLNSQSYFGSPFKTEQYLFSTYDPCTAAPVNADNYNNFGDDSFCNGSKYHSGKDYLLYRGTFVHAVGDGVVIKDVSSTTSGDHGLGRTVIIEHTLLDGSKIYSQYSHLSSTYYCESWLIKKGDIIGEVGGSAYGCEDWDFSNGTCPTNPDNVGHLHLEFKSSLFLGSDESFLVCGNKDDNIKPDGPPCGHVNSSDPSQIHTQLNYYGFLDPDLIINNIMFKEDSFVSIVCAPNMLPATGANPPDVYIDNYSISSNNVNQGDVITISVRQNLLDYNNGNISSTIKYWLSSDINLDISSDIYIGSDVSTIGTDPYDNESISYTIPSLPDGTYYILIQADSENILPNELSEQNNLVGIPVVISALNNSINLTLYQNSLSGTEGESIVISGSGVYNNGNTVFVGTVIITTSNNTYTASMLNGNFSKLIYLPPNSGSITVQLSDGTFSDTESIPISVTSGSSGNGYNVLNYTTCVSNDNVNMPCEFFSDHIKNYEDIVFFWIELNNNTGPTQARFKIYSPDGVQYDSHSSSIENDPYTYFYYSMPVAGTLASDLQGEWTVEYYAREAVAGSIYDYIGSTTFVLSHVLSEHKMCKNVSSNQPVNVTNTFCNSDNRVYSWANYQGQSNPLEVRAEWYEPNGSLNTQIPYSLSDPGPEPQAWFPNRQQWMYLDLSSASMKKKTGDWQIKYYTQDPFGSWDLEYTDHFQLVECPNISPTITAGSNSPITEGQNVILNLNATDNGYLNNVTLYHRINSGSWQTSTYSDLNLSTYSLSNYNIGSFSEGDVIQFYAEAIDNSGNIDGSDTETIIIQDSDIVGPIISNIIISENTGNNDGSFQDTEILKFQASISDPSGISAVQYYIDGNQVTLSGNYFVLDGTFSPGDHTLTIVAYDNDFSQSISTHVETFSICDNIYYIDNDGDGYGASIVYDCVLRNNYVTVLGDCDDNNANVSQLTKWYADSDFDGFGDPVNFTYSCYVPSGYIGISGDCDDSNPTVNENLNEVCDGLDNNCNGLVDEDDTCCNTNLSCSTSVSSYFESFENGISLFIQDNCDDMDWVLNSGGTASQNTGPTDALNGGNYLYVEATGNPNKKAVLHSLCIDLTSYREPALLYGTHFRGDHMGSLDIEISTDLGSSWQYLNSHIGEDDNVWYYNVISLIPYKNNDVIIRLSGTTTNGYQGDMAIDFFHIHERCEDDAIMNRLTGPYDYYIETHHSIQSFSVLGAGGNITYDAGNHILLKQGFEVKLGATFLAKIEGCDSDFYSIKDNIIKKR